MKLLNVIKLDQLFAGVKIVIPGLSVFVINYQTPKGIMATMFSGN